MIDKLNIIFHKNFSYSSHLICINYIYHLSQVNMSDFDLMMQKKKIVRTTIHYDINVFRNLERPKIWKYFIRWIKKLEREGMRYEKIIKDVDTNIVLIISNDWNLCNLYYMICLGWGINRYRWQGQICSYGNAWICKSKF